MFCEKKVKSNPKSQQQTIVGIITFECGVKNSFLFLLFALIFFCNPQKKNSHNGFKTVRRFLEKRMSRHVANS
jgi:hypothetical protein